MRSQKKRVQLAIRKWYVRRVQIALFNGELGLDWDATWRGMRAECSSVTGLALSTINRYWGAIMIRGEIPDCYDVIEGARKWGIKEKCPYERVKSLGGGFNVYYCKEGRWPYMVTWGWPADGYHKSFYSSLAEALEDNDDL